MISLAARLYLYIAIPAQLANPWDSIDYGRYAQKIIHEGSLESFFNPVRPPLYPVLLAVSFLLTGVKQDDSIYFALNEAGGVPVAIFQTIMGISSVMILYVTLRSFVHRSIAGIFSLLFAVHPLIIPWDRYVLTESLSLSFAIFYIRSAQLFLQKQTLSRTVFLLFTGLLGVWLRSLYIALVPLTLVVFILKRRDLRSVAIAYGVGMVFCLPIAVHILINNRNYQTPTLQVMSTINLYGRLLIHPYPVSVIEDNEISTWMQRHYTPGVYDNPFPILEGLSPEVYHDHVLIQSIETYNQVTILKNLPRFIRNCLLDIPAMFTVNPSIMFSTFPQWYLAFQKLTVVNMAIASVALVLLPAILYLFLRKKTLVSMMTVCSGVFALYFLSTSIVFGYVDSSRYATGAIPFLLVYSAGLIQLFIDRHEKRK